MRTLFILSLSLISLSACASVERLAIPKNELVNSALRQVGQQEKVNHTQWDQFLRTYTRKDNDGVVRVDYADISSADRAMLKSYIHKLEILQTDDLSKDAQLAYWANLYNAQTVDVILDNYPTDSIRNIKDGFFDLGPWENKRLTVAGRSTSLHDIEHGIVRPLWKGEPNIHYILNCAAAGCPNLGQGAFTAENIQERMHAAAIAYINNERGVSVLDDGRIVASKIYSWYLDDFGGSHTSIITHLKTYAQPELKAAIEARGVIDDFTYDWSLNDTKRANTLESASLPPIAEYN